MSAPVIDWTPPAGMDKPTAATWPRVLPDSLPRLRRHPPCFYRQMYLAQSGRCYICRTAKGIHPDDPKARGTRRLGIDHNHAIGPRVEAVRGLLCTGSLSANTCNRLIARYSEDQLTRAALYLSVPPAQTLRGMLRAYGPMDDEKLTGVLT